MDVATEKLVPYARNSRTHSDEQVAQLMASIREFGWTNPVLIDEDDMILAGHGRVLAAQRLGLETVPCRRLSHLSEAQKRAYVIADNRLALNAGWDEAMLSVELGDLNADGFDLELLGFDGKELEELLSLGDGTDIVEDEVPEPPEIPVTQPGDLWLLGPHRLLCGDATSAAAVTRVLDGHTPFIMVTDPPYGVNYDPTFRSSNRTGDVANDDRADWQAAYSLFPGMVAYVWHGNLHVVTVAEDLLAAGFDLRAYILWKKPHLVMGRSHYHWQHEPCFYAAKGSSKWCGDRTQSTVWDIKHVHPTLGTKDDGETVHGCQKPVECMARPIRNHGGKGDDVYDPFLGSGTTMIAAEQLGRRCFGLELEPRYCDVIVERWERLTGGKAERVVAEEAAA